jgi:hypothetical protein
MATFAKRRSNRPVSRSSLVVQLVQVLLHLETLLYRLMLCSQDNFSSFLRTPFNSFFSNSISALEQAMHQRIVFSPHLFTLPSGALICKTVTKRLSSFASHDQIYTLNAWRVKCPHKQQKRHERTLLFKSQQYLSSPTDESFALIDDRFSCVQSA